MGTVFDIAFSFPTSIFTVMLGVALVYWSFVIVGAVDVDSFGHADGALEGAADAGGEALAEGLVDGALEGAAHGVGHGAADGVADGVGHAHDCSEAIAGGGDGALGLFSALQLRRVPITVSTSLFAAFGWLFTCLGMQTLGPWWAETSMPSWLLTIPLLLVASLLALVGTSGMAQPLGKLFVTHGARKNSDLVGKVCIISTGRVSEKFGQATLEDGGAGLILQVRARAGNALKRGDHVLIIGWDQQSGGFSVEAMDDVMASEKGAPAAAKIRESKAEEAAWTELESTLEAAKAEEQKTSVATK